MSEQGTSGGPHFIVEHQGRLYRTQTVEELDGQDPQMQAMLNENETGRAVRLPDLSYKSFTASAANIGNQDVQAMEAANIGEDQSISAANIGDQNQSMAQPMDGANIGEDNR